LFSTSTEPDDTGYIVGKMAEVLVAANEVRFAVDLDEHANVVADERGHGALGSNAAGLLAGGGQALLAKDLRGLFHVSIGFGQGRLDVHHAGAGLLAQRLHHCGGYLCHVHSP